MTYQQEVKRAEEVFNQNHPEYVSFRPEIKNRASDLREFAGIEIVWLDAVNLGFCPTPKGIKPTVLIAFCKPQDRGDANKQYIGMQSQDVFVSRAITWIKNGKTPLPLGIPKKKPSPRNGIPTWYFDNS